MLTRDWRNPYIHLHAWRKERFYILKHIHSGNCFLPYNVLWCEHNSYFASRSFSFYCNLVCILWFLSNKLCWRYELCFTGEKTLSSITTSQSLETEKDKPQTHNANEQNGERSTADRDMLVDVFRWSRCKTLLPQKIMRSIGIPLPLEYIEVLWFELKVFPYFTTRK